MIVGERVKHPWSNAKLQSETLAADPYLSPKIHLSRCLLRAHPSAPPSYRRPNLRCISEHMPNQHVGGTLNAGKSLLPYSDLSSKQLPSAPKTVTRQTIAHRNCTPQSTIRPAQQSMLDGQQVRVRWQKVLPLPGQQADQQTAVHEKQFTIQQSSTGRTLSTPSLVTHQVGIIT